MYKSIILDNFRTKRIDINVITKNFSDNTEDIEILKNKLRETEEKFINDNANYNEKLSKRRFDSVLKTVLKI